VPNDKKHIISELTEFLFYNKNKDFGAYVLRQKSSKYSFFGATAGTLTIVFAYILLMLWAKNEMPDENSEQRQVEVSITPYAKLEPPPPVEKEPEPPPILKEPPKVATKRYVRQELKPDKEVVEEEYIPTVEELRKSNPGIETREGSDDIHAVYNPVVEPPPPPSPPPPPPPPKKEEVFTFVQKLPEFPGGESAMQQFIRDHLNYPIIALDSGISGTVVLQFTVNKSGKITDPEIVRDIGGGCGDEALRVLLMMPNWIPGEQGGIKVNVRYTLPVRFVLRQ
jgi:periplasmic protein TonB